MASPIYNFRKPGILPDAHGRFRPSPFPGDSATARQGSRGGRQRRPPLQRQHAAGDRRRLGTGRAVAAADAAAGRFGEVGDRAQRFARYRLRPVAQPLPWLRAWLHLLLCAADARVPGTVAGPRFRDADLPQAGGAATAARRAVPPGLCLRDDRARHGDRRLPAVRAQAAADARTARGAAGNPPPGFGRHQVVAHRPRHRLVGRAGAAQPRPCRNLADHPRRPAGAPARTAGERPAGAAGGDAPVERGGHPGFGFRGAADSRPQRPRNGKAAHAPPATTAPAAPATRCCACRTRLPECSASGSTGTRRRRPRA